MKMRFILITAALLMGGCTMKETAFDRAALTDKTFNLQSVDGVTPAPGARQPTIHFAADDKVSGAMCNRFFGQGEFSGHKLTVKQLASTQMLCPDATLNQWDQLIGETLQQGVQISLEKEILTLKGEKHTLVYKAQ